jgi:hypothetical protein
LEFPEINIPAKIPLPDHIRELFIELCSVGFFKESILIGTWAITFYRAIYNVIPQAYTSDIDLAVQLLQNKKMVVKVDLEEVFRRLGYTSNLATGGLQRFFRLGYDVEFLVHDRRLKGKDVIMIPEWNINAQPLPFIRFLLENTQKIYTENYYVRIPIPEAFFFHKLIISQRRQREEKRTKDLGQCKALSRVLDNERLQLVAKSEKLSVKTKKLIQKSCETIDFPFERLEI